MCNLGQTSILIGELWGVNMETYTSDSVDINNAPRL